ncbi:MAG TPA: SBBP repeat-containing protein, partial [Bryobacteraceae bacterium]|nr:SBBP repeat-containing protein [Bryobacteraceae bacterium]
MLRSVFFITLFAAGVAYGSVIFEPAGDGRMALVRGSAGAVVLRSDRADFQTGPASVAMVLDGARQRRPLFEEPLPGFSNYFSGSTPGQWRTGVPHYARVRFADVLPRVDLVYYGQESKLEYDFVLRPGANPRSIRLSFPGARKVRVRDGNLVISTSDGRELLHRRPLVYQQSHRWRAEVPARWRIDGEGRARIEPGVYDTSKPLIIDPVVEMASWIGKTGQDAAFAIATDSAGNAWVAGETNSPDLGTGGAYQSARALPTDAFLAKIAPDGAVLAITYYGGSKSDTGLGVAVDSSGNAYLLGVTSSPDLPVPGAAQESFAGGEHDVFVAKFDPSASRLLWATYAGGSHAEWAGSITTDAAGNPWITGWTLSADYPLAGALQRGTAGGGGDAFLTRIAAWGGSFTYSTYFGAEGIDQGSGVAVDGAGNVHLTGMSESNALPVTPATLPRRAGKGDAFYAKLDPVRNQLLVCTYVGGMGVDYGVRAATDRDGNGYVAGYTQSADLRITPGSFQTKPGGGTDIFVARINAASGNLDYATYLGGSGEDWLGGLAVDAAGSASVSGWSNSRDFPLRTPAQGANAGGDRANTGGFDAVAARLSPSGANLVYSTYYGGAGEDRALGVAVDAAGRTWLAGTTSSRDLPSAAGAFSAGPFTEEDAFVVKFSADAGAVFLTVNPAAVNVTVRSGANGVPPISLQVRPSAGTVPFSVSSDVGWLRPVQTTGTAPAQLSVTLESFCLPLGEHTGNIVIRSAADTVSVPVKVSVTAAPTITAVTPPALTAGSPDTR